MFLRFTRSGKRRAVSGINSTQAFRTILERERARADRYMHGFSLVVFDLGESDVNSELLSRLTHALIQRKRSTDQVGWFDDRSVGVMLPATTVDESRQFVHDIFRKIGNTDATPPYRIYRYPWEANSRDTDSLCLGVVMIQSAGSHTSEMQSDQFTTERCSGTVERVEPLFGRAIPAWKRAIDILVSIILLVCLLPVFVVLGIFIRMVSPGPVFFRQKRVGYQGRVFTIWKFRTMRVDADASVHQNRVSEVLNAEKQMRKLDRDDDPRIIPFGKVLRQTGLDELPQLFNVLRGEMSLVGPRPDPVYAVQQYPPWYRARLDVLPGITGLWQVNGKNRTTFKEMIRLDIAYTRQQSLWLDARIVLRTVPAIIDQVTDRSSKRE